MHRRSSRRRIAAGGGKKFNFDTRDRTNCPLRIARRFETYQTDPRQFAHQRSQVHGQRRCKYARILGGLQKDVSYQSERHGNRYSEKRLGQNFCDLCAIGQQY